MGMNEEESLTATLIDPEALDSPNRVYEKGEKQDPAKCRDAWAAVLFYAQFIAVACVCGIFGVPAVQKNMNNVDDASMTGSTDYTGLIYRELYLLTHVVCLFHYVTK